MPLTSMTKQLVTNWTDSFVQSSCSTWIWEGDSMQFESRLKCYSDVWGCHVNEKKNINVPGFLFISIWNTEVGSETNDKCHAHTYKWTDLVLCQQHGTAETGLEGGRGRSLPTYAHVSVQWDRKQAVVTLYQCKISATSGYKDAQLYQRIN